MGPAIPQGGPGGKGVAIPFEGLPVVPVPGTVTLLEGERAMARILVVGSVAQDDVVHLKEPLVEGRHVEGAGKGVRLGGGGPNTALPLAAAGHSVAVIAAVGEDAAGDRLISELAAGGVDTSLIRVLDDAVTTRSIIMVDGIGERTIVNLARTTEPEPPRRLIETPADCLYVRSRARDLGPLLAEKAQACCVVAHIPPCGAGERPAHVLVGSESDLDADVLADPVAAGRRIAGDMLEWVVITHGEKGASAYGTDGRVVERAAEAVEPVDSTGAGDSFAAGLIHALASGAGMETALAVAVAWGTESVRWKASTLPAEAVVRLTAA